MSTEGLNTVTIYGTTIEQTNHEIWPERGQKISYAMAWAGKDERRIDKLKVLHQQIKSLTNK